MIEIQKLNKDKGLTSKDDFGVVPLGKKGQINKFVAENGKTILLEFGASILDNDRRNIISCISFAMTRVGYEQMESIIQRPLEVFRDTGQYSYTTFKVKASSVSQLLYGTNREGRAIMKSLKKGTKLNIDIEDTTNSFSQLHNIAFKDGYIIFDVVNILINHIAKTRLPFRIQKTLLHQNFDYRLSFYIETNQFEKNGGSYPKQVYKLDDILDGLNIGDSSKSSKHLSSTIKKISESFKNLHDKDDDFPLYLYNKDKKWWENKYKKSGELHIKSTILQ